MEPLLPVRHPTRDFFVCDVFDGIPYFKDDMASMEHPMFSLSTKLDTRILHYEHNGNTVTITPSIKGLATIHDKDILLYCVSHLRAAMAEGREPSQIVRFTGYNMMVSTNRRTDGDSYQRFKAGLERLQGTVINTNIKTGGYTIEEGFGIIDWWRAVKEDESGRVIAAEIKLSDWMYNAVLGNELLTINRDYFRIRKPLERRIYELARKHCGEQAEWKIGLKNLQKKTGSSSALKEFRRLIGKLIETDHLPDYSVSMDADMLTFQNRNRAARKSPATLPLLLLKTETYEKAKRAAPGYDVYALEDDWRGWIAGKGIPKNPDAAFIGFCKSRFQKYGRP
jgi:plasmid replication initiation protein